MKNPHAVALGKLGGAAGTGAAKIRRRTKAQSRQMALKGWETRRLNGKDLSLSTRYLDEARANVDKFLNK